MPLAALSNAVTQFGDGMIDIIQHYSLLLLIGTYPNGPIGGLAGTLILALLALVLSMPCALALALARLSNSPLLSNISIAIVWVMRGTPFLMVIFWAYFLLPLAVGTQISPFLIMIGALVVYEGAYLSEIIRASILALPRGQREAAAALGLSRSKTMFLVILPQALYNALPALVGQFISIIKETSLGYVIGVQEFTFSAAQINSVELTKPVEVFSLLALVYFVLCFCLSQSARWLETRINSARVH